MNHVTVNCKTTVVRATPRGCPTPAADTTMITATLDQEIAMATDELLQCLARVQLWAAWRNTEDAIPDEATTARYQADLDRAAAALANLHAARDIPHR